MKKNAQQSLQKKIYQDLLQLSEEIVRPLHKIETMPDTKNLSRKNFFSSGIRNLASLLVRPLEKKISRAHGLDVRLLFPPGAVPGEEFRILCSKCGKCAEVCPNQAIQISSGVHGFSNYGYPYINPEAKPCIGCSDLPCVSACEEGALVPISPHEIFLGKAVINQELCLAWQGETCANCSYACRQFQAIVLVEQKPFVDTHLCTGCGICYHACPSEAGAIQIVPRAFHFPSFRLRRQKGRNR